MLRLPSDPIFTWGPSTVAFFVPYQEYLLFRSCVCLPILAVGTVVPTKICYMVEEAVPCAIDVERNSFIGFLGLVTNHFEWEIQILEVLEVGFVFGVGDLCATSRVPSRGWGRWQWSDRLWWWSSRWCLLLPKRLE